MEKIIIHICGTSGSGKTYLGELLKKNKKFNVIDIDDWTEEFELIKNKSKNIFNKFISNKINNLNDNKINILVGYIDCYINNEIIIFNIDTYYKFFIKINLNDLFLQYNTRVINYICKNKSLVINNLKKNKLVNLKTKEQLKNNYKCDLNNYVNKLNYKLLTQEQIINNIKHNFLY